MNEEVNKSMCVIGIWFSLAQLQNPARDPAYMTGEKPLPLAKQHDLKAMAATLNGSQQVTSGRFKIDAILLHHLVLLGNS